MAGPDKPHEQEARPEVIIYTDGGADPNPGRGGYGAILLCGAHRQELSGGYRLTTNNRMELLAAIHAFERLKQPCRITLHTDSQYLKNGIMQGWARKWRSRGWMRTPKERALNADLWARLLDLCEGHEATFLWVRGHTGHPENERCDALATLGRAAPELPDDDGYPEKPRPATAIQSTLF